MIECILDTESGIQNDFLFNEDPQTENVMVDLKRNFKTLEQQAYEALKDMILFGEIKSAVRLTEEAMARDLGVSRTTVKKAFIRLKEEGLLEDASPQGVQVRLLSIEEVVEAYEIRALLEGMAGRMAARSLKESEIGEMIRKFKAFKHSGGDAGSKEYFRLNFDLHSMIAGSFQNRSVSRLVLSLIIQTRYFHGGYPSLRASDDSLQDHLDILYALQNKDEDLSEELMKRHVRKIKEAFILSMKQATRKNKRRYDHE